MEDAIGEAYKLGFNSKNIAVKRNEIFQTLI
jgi:hypothetical protein